MSLEFDYGLTYENLQHAYRITMFSMWGIGVDIPRLMVRYARSYPAVTNFHAISMMIIGFLTIMYVIAMTSLFYSERYPLGERLQGASLAAFASSWVLTAGVVVQLFLGLRVRYLILSQKLSLDMFTIKSVHRYLGISLSLLGKITVAFQLYTVTQEILFRSWLFVVGALFLLFGIVEGVYRIQTRSLMLKFPLKHKVKSMRLYEEILQNINNHVEDWKDYRKLGVRYIILDNVMYYFDEQFIHPGGEYIFSLFCGQEVNYLFRGTHQLLPDFPRHMHTKYAINYLEERKVGEIQVQSILLNTTAEVMELFQWKIVALEQMDGDSMLVQFHVPEAYIRNQFAIQNFGKYMMICCPSQELVDKLQRPYSIVLSLSEFQCRILHRFKSAYKTHCLGSSSSLASADPLESQQTQNSILTFCIKRYRAGAFTNFMFSSWKDKVFSVMGPYGRGLCLNKIKGGFYIIVAAGTGILPFIDLFHYLLIKTLNQLIEAQVGEVTSRRLNEERIDYSQLQNTRILLVGSFQSSKHFYLDSVIKDLYHLNTKHSLKQFDLWLKYNSMETEPNIRMLNSQFDAAFVKELLEMNPNRLYYCGPPNIEHIIRKVQAQTKTPTSFFYV